MTDRSRMALLLTYLLSTMYNVSFFLQMMLLPYIGKSIGMHDRHFGYMQTAFGIVQMIGGPLFGVVCSRIGLRNGLVLVYASTICSHVLTYFAHDIPTLILSRLPCLFMHGQQAHQMVLSSLTTAGQQRTNAFGRMGLTFGISFLFVPIISTGCSRFFANADGRVPILVAIMIAFGAIATLIGCLSQHLPTLSTSNDSDDATAATSSSTAKLDVHSLIRIMRYANVWQLFALKNLATIPLFLFLSIFQIYLINEFDVSPETNSMITMLIGVCITLANGFGVVALRSYFSESRLLLIGIIDLLLTFTMMMFFSRLWMVIIIMPGEISHPKYANFNDPKYVNFAEIQFYFAGMSLGMCLLGTVCDSQLTAVVPNVDHGTVLGFSHALNALERALSPSIAGVLLEYVGFGAFGCIGVVCSLAAGALWTTFGGNVRQMDDERKQQ